MSTTRRLRMLRHWPPWRRGPRRSRAASAAELVWLLEHPPLYTAGTSARPDELIDARFPVYRAGRGGQFTYHGPGQRVGLCHARPQAPRAATCAASSPRSKEWLIRHAGRASTSRASAATTGSASGCARPDKPRDDGDAEDKIAAIGIRVRHWVTLHGVALNVEPDLGHFRHRAVRRPKRATASPGWPISAAGRHGGGRCRTAARLRDGIRPHSTGG